MYKSATPKQIAEYDELKEQLSDVLANTYELEANLPPAMSSWRRCGKHLKRYGPSANPIFTTTPSHMRFGRLR